MSQNYSTSSSTFSWLQHALEKRSASGAGMVAVVALGFLGSVQIVPNSAIVWTIFAIILYEFQKRLDQGVPLLQLSSIIAVLQWLIGPSLNYSSGMTFGRYSMYVPESLYFQFAIPATSFFVAVMLLVGSSVKQRNLLRVVERRNFFAIGVVLNVVAIGATVAATRAGGGMQFFLHLLSQLRYVGALYFLFSLHPLRLLFVAGSCFALLSSSLGSGMFHDLILWLAILFCYWFALRKWVLGIKLVIMTFAAIGLFAIQVIKQEYRQQLKNGLDPSIVRMMIDYVTPGGKAWETSTLSLAITRLNQGWIISAIMKHVPENEPFAAGETVKEAVLGSIAPRFLWTDKKTAGGRVSFRRFTGLQIGEATSMGISPLGEAYANFGIRGGIGFMVVFGSFFALFYYGTLRYALKHPTFLFWIPLIFYQAMKAETEISVVMNQLTKGSVVAFGGFYLLGQVLPVRLKKSVAARAAPAQLLSSQTPSLSRVGTSAVSYGLPFNENLSRDD